MGLFDNDGDDLALAAVAEVKKVKRVLEDLHADFNNSKDEMSELKAEFAAIRKELSDLSLALIGRSSQNNVTQTITTGASGTQIGEVEGDVK